jgi:hemerythrin-like domain-containing protein
MRYGRQSKQMMPNQARDLVSQLGDLLHGHAAREERGVFTQLRREVLDESYVAMFEHDHEVLHGLLEACAAEDWHRPAGELVDVLSEHIVREETDLFPAAHQMLEPGSAVDAAVLELAAVEVAR